MAIIIRISLDRILVAVIVAILPLIMHLLTLIRVFPSWNGLKFSFIPLLKSALFLFGSYTNKISSLLYVSKTFGFYIYHVFPVLRRILYSYGFWNQLQKFKQINQFSKWVSSSTFWLINIVLNMPPYITWLCVKNSSPIS